VRREGKVEVRLTACEGLCHQWTCGRSA
jgi:hypothetical protein